MIIRSLKIEGFGLYSNTGIDEIKPGITVICAENGGGKTTFREFLRAMLFGFSRNASRYEPWSTTPHRGVLQFETQDGQNYRLLRSFGRSQVELTRVDGQPAPELSILLNSAPIDLYKNVFAIGLHELQEAKLLDDDRVKAMIGGFGSAHAGKALIDASKTLKGEIEQRFKPGGQRPRINELLQNVEKEQRELNQANSEAEKYWSYEEQLLELNSQIKQLSESEIPLRQRRDSLVVFNKAWPEWVQLQSLRRQLAEVTPVVERFPENGIARLEELFEKIRVCHEETKRHRVGIEEDEKQLRNLIGADDLVPYSSSLDELIAGRNQFETNGQNLAKAKVESEHLYQNLVEGLRQLGNWSEERLLSFDQSLPATAKRGEATRSLKSASARLSELDRELLTVGRLLSAKVTEESNARIALANQNVPPTHNEIDNLTQKVSQARQALSNLLNLKEEANRLRQELEEAKQQLALFSVTEQPPAPDTNLPQATSTAKTFKTQQKKIVLSGFIVCGGLLLAALSIRDMTVAVIAATMGLMGGGLVWWLLPDSGEVTSEAKQTGANSSQANQNQLLLKSRELWQQKVAFLQANINKNSSAVQAANATLESLTQFFKTPIQSLEHCEQIEQKLRLYREERRRFELAEQEVIALGRRVKELQLQHDTLKSDVQFASQSIANEENQWKAWLQRQGLDLNLSPEVVESLCGEVTRVRQIHSQWQSIQKNVNQLESICSAYWAKLTRFLSTINRPLPSGENAESQESIFKVLRGLKQECDDARAKANQREVTKRGMEEKQRELNLALNRQRLLQTDYESLMREGEANNREEFRVRAEAAQNRRVLKEKIQVQLGRLETLSGPGDAVLKLQKELEQYDHQSLQNELEQTEVQWQGYAQQLAELSEQKGNVETARDHLASSDDVAILAQQLESGKAELEEVADEWAVRSLALWLLNESRNKFEQERQPAVLQSASSCLNAISDGQFTKIVQPLDKEKYQLMQSDGGFKSSDQEWNTGLKEQVYWSLRIGLIEDYATRAEPLPLVVDDAFVNFDPERLKGAIQCLNEVAQRHQIFFLTCHRHTEALLREFALDAQFFKVQDGRFLAN